MIAMGGCSYRRLLIDDPAVLRADLALARHYDIVRALSATVGALPEVHQSPHNFKHFSSRFRVAGVSRTRP